MEETKETSTQPEGKSPEEKSQETSTWLKEMNDVKIVGRNGEELNRATSEEENTDEEGKTNEEEKPKEFEKILKIKVNNKEEEFNLEDDTQRNKAIEYMQKGRYTESIREAKAELEQQTELANQEFGKLSYAYLMNINDGKIALEEPKRSDYFESGGKYYNNFQYEEDADKAYKEAVKNYDSTSKALREYQSEASKSYESYKQTISEFTSKHPNVDNVKQFIADHVNPKIKPLLSMGAEPLPIELLEAIYTHVYLDEIIREAIEKDRKNLAKGGKPKKEVSEVKVDEKEEVKPVWGGSNKNVKIRFR